MDDKKYILTLDQGTSSSRAILFDQASNVIGICQEEITQIYPKSGWVEHDPLNIWETTLKVLKSVIIDSKINTEDISCIGITNQRETTIVWDRSTGTPIHNAIVWQDNRTAKYCDSLIAKGHGEMIRSKTGLILNPYFSATKLRYILHNVDGAMEKAKAGQLAFGTVDSWLLWNLTAGKVHATDASNASRTMLYNIHTLDWDDDLLELVGIPKSILPKVHSCDYKFGNTDLKHTGFNISITGIAGDQQSALFGQMCTEPGMLKNTYGTGCFLVVNTGKKAVTSKNNLLTTIGWKIGEDVTYALEGSVFVGGSVIQWLRDGIQIIDHAKDSENLASSLVTNEGVYLVPAFVGLGAPYWDPKASGMIIGLTRGSTRSHIARAALESIAYQTKDVVNAMTSDLGKPIGQLRVDGGAVGNKLLMQFQSDILGIEVIIPKVMETTALGAAYFAGLGAGLYNNIDEIKENWKEHKRFTPQMSETEKDSNYTEWKDAVNRSRNWNS